MSVQELLLDNSKDPMDDCNIGRVSDEVTWTKKMPPINLDCIKKESHMNNYNKSNHDGNRIGNEEQRLDNLENSE